MANFSREPVSTEDIKNAGKIKDLQEEQGQKKRTRFTKTPIELLGPAFLVVVPERDYSLCIVSGFCHGYSTKKFDGALY